MTERISPAEFRKELFSQLESVTRVCGEDEYKKIYALSQTHWGINSPACIVYKNFFPSHPFPEVLPQDLKGEIFIAINKDAVPDPTFIKYLKLHEYWEHYTRIKPGFNLLKDDEEDYQLPISQRKRPAHKLAVVKEFEAAETDGNLENYMEWWRTFYQNDIKRISDLPESEIIRISSNYDGRHKSVITEFIKKNLELRESIYDLILKRRKTK